MKGCETKNKQEFLSVRMMSIFMTDRSIILMLFDAITNRAF